jgi:hypothetical protein
MMALAGVGILAAAIAVLQGMRPRNGQVVVRSEWIESSAAILVTAGIGLGVTMLVAGTVHLLSP